MFSSTNLLTDANGTPLTQDQIDVLNECHGHATNFTDQQKGSTMSYSGYCNYATYHVATYHHETIERLVREMVSCRIIDQDYTTPSGLVDVIRDAVLDEVDAAGNDYEFNEQRALLDLCHEADYYEIVIENLVSMLARSSQPLGTNHE